MRHIPACFLLTVGALFAQSYDIVISGGRVMDPESGLDAIRNVGIAGNRIAAVSARKLEGKTVVEASGLVVAPGFIDLHWHGTDPATGRYQLLDGVTAAFELEVGTEDVEKWYAERAGKWLVHYGVSAGHIRARMKVLGDTGELVPTGPAATMVAAPEQIVAIRKVMERAFAEGAVAAGFGPAYTPAASHWEILEMFRAAAAAKASAHVHIRGGSSAFGPGADRVAGASEVIAASAITGAGLQIVHVQSSGQADTPKLLRMIAEARARGVDVTTECYPYAAGSTRLESTVFDNFANRPDPPYHTIQWVATGERLNADTFQKYRKVGGLVIIHSNTEEVVRGALLSPLTMIGSDGFDIKPKQGHPRGAGSHARILGRYVRDEGALPLMEALGKMTILPARRLERRVPEMQRKGRIREGADADITVFDPKTIRDRATYEEPAQASEGVRHVLVGGTLAVRNGAVIEGVTAGQPVRAPRTAVVQ